MSTDEFVQNELPGMPETPEQQTGNERLDTFFEDEATNPDDVGSVSSTALATYTQRPDFDSSDVFIPRAKLAQGLTKEVQDGSARPGQFVVTGYGAFDKLTIVPMFFSRKREMRDSENMVICNSDDGITGVGDPGGECRTCPFDIWTGEGDKRKPPACTFAYSYICYIAECETMAVVEFKKTSIQAGKTLNTLVAQRGLGKVVVELTGESRKNSRGTFGVIHVAPIPANRQILTDAQAVFGG